ncbi:MAG TPA: DUF305 domain-containing protein [Gemmatimonadales bacterium]|nr:DUF305 domain-containing protein [Gemmatimonadales bacterium]
MTATAIRGAWATLLTAGALSACGGPPAVQTAPSPEPSAAQGEPAALSRAKADSARYTAADIHFMSGMIHHHAQAIVMANWAPTHGASPAVLRLAERIINAQTDEIAIMQQWLQDRRQPVPEARATGMKMTMGGMEHEMLMPGMLSDSQMQQLDTARGAEFDRLFLLFMIQHHKGAITMVQELLGSYGAGQDQTVFKFASDVNVDQTTEIARMEKMLVALLTSPD